MKLFYPFISEHPRSRSIKGWLLLAGFLTVSLPHSSSAMDSVRHRAKESGNSEGLLVYSHQKRKEICDSLKTSQRDSLHQNRKSDGSHLHEPFELNKEAVKLIQFDFTSSPNVTAPPKTAEMKKSWMDFRVDLAVPKNLTDTTKIRKPSQYIRMLPYTIWTRFGEDPVFDVLVFGNKKRLEIQWKLNLNSYNADYGRNLMPQAGRDAAPMGSGVCINNLDIIGFLYDNLNKHGRTLKRNRKRAKAWKVYQNYKTTRADSLKFPNFYLSAKRSEVMDSCAKEAKKSYEFTGLDYRPQTVLQLDPSLNREQTPDYRMLQTPEHRSRFGTFHLPNPFEADPDSISLSLQKDTLRVESQERGDSIQVDSNQRERSARKKKKSRRDSKRKEETLEELPDSMDELYKYIRMKQAQDSLKRKELFRKDKVSSDIYETEKQIRRFKEQQE